jgi:hypothetical protein
MAKADQENIPERWFEKDDWAALRAHLNGCVPKLDRDKVQREIDLLEIAFRRFDRDMKLLMDGRFRRGRPKTALAKYDRIHAASAALVRELRAEESCKFRSGTSITRHTFSCEQRLPPDFVECIIKVRDRYAETAASLRRFRTSHRKIHTFNKRDCEDDLKETVFDIGQRLLGLNEIGRNDSELIMFMNLALRIKLGERAPSESALRGFAYRYRARLRRTSRPH